MNKRPNGTVRTKTGIETKKCLYCEEDKDVINFQSYWYQPKRCSKPYGDPVRRRLNKCKTCVKKRDLSNKFSEKV